MPLAALDIFSAKTTRIDTSSFDHFKQAYFELYEAAYNPGIMQTPASLSNTIDQLKDANNSGSLIPIGIISYKFNVIDTLALRKNLFSLQNNLLYDVTSRTSSPYQWRTTLVAAALVPRVNAGVLTFTLPASLIKSNLIRSYLKNA
jgi:hypothetical protein